MLKTYCFIYRRFGWQEPETICVKAYGYVQALSETRRKLKWVDDIAQCYLVPARRSKIKHCINAMKASYKEECKPC